MLKFSVLPTFIAASTLKVAPQTASCYIVGYDATNVNGIVFEPISITIVDGV